MTSTSARLSARDLREIQTLPQLVKYLKAELHWPVESADFLDIDDVTFDWSPDELGIEASAAAKIEYIKQLRPLEDGQPQGVFFVKFDARKLPVVALRRVLSRLVLRKRAVAHAAERPLWNMRDLVFISSFGETDARQLSFAYFQDTGNKDDLPTLKVLGWDNRDTPLHLDTVDQSLRAYLRWPDRPTDLDAWRRTWAAAFTLRNMEVVETSKDLSKRLAELARAIRDRITAALHVETERGPLTKLLRAFQESLVHDLDANGFADMYAQTIAYGLLSARIADPRTKTADDFAAHLHTSAFLRELMETFLQVGGRRGKSGGPGIDFDELGVAEVVELLDHANMEAVVRDFGDRNPLEDPVIHFYQHFLHHYSPETQIERGVFYTPRPLVAFIVRAIDDTLRAEFGIADGLADSSTWADVESRNKAVRRPTCFAPADPFVTIVDPACGTGTFLVEVIDFVFNYLDRKWKNEGKTPSQRITLWNDYVPDHLLPRLYGFELMMAPYAVAHMKLGIKLLETGYTFKESDRLHILLTNTLEEPKDYSKQLKEFAPTLAHAASIANAVKRKKRFTVVIGNPPYANKGQLNQGEWIKGLLEDYKRGLSSETKLNLDDDYIKFVRWAQWNVMEAGLGAIGFVTGNTYLVPLTRRRMRESLSSDFSRVSVLDLHGNANIQEKCPDGSPDRNVFDIRQGVCISILARTPGGERKAQYRDLYGERELKYRTLLTATLDDRPWHAFSPAPPNFFFSPKAGQDTASSYDKWCPVNELFANAISGVQTKRDHFTIHRTSESLKQVLEDLRTMRIDQVRKKYDLGDDGRDWKIALARADVAAESGNIVPIFWKAFDERVTYYSGKTKGFHAYPRRELMRNMLQDNLGFVFKRQGKLDGKPYSYFLVVDKLISEGLFAIDARGREFLAPLFVYPENGDLFRGTNAAEPNVSADAMAKLASSVSLPVKSCATSHVSGFVTPLSFLFYLYGLVSSTEYRTKYAAELALDHPRVPLSPSRSLYESLVAAGADLVGLHTLSDDYPYTTWAGGPRSRNPLLARSPHFVGPSTAVLEPGYPRFEGSRILVSSGGYFDAVDEATWNTIIGGYQVCEKWLKSRSPKRGEAPVRLTKNEVVHYERLLRAMAATRAVVARIDSAIAKAGAFPFAFAPAEPKI